MQNALFPYVHFRANLTAALAWFSKKLENIIKSQTSKTGSYRQENCHSFLIMTDQSESVGTLKLYAQFLKMLFTRTRCKNAVCSLCIDIPDETAHDCNFIRMNTCKYMWVT